jgi:hypothetical protein
MAALLCLEVRARLAAVAELLTSHTRYRTPLSCVLKPGREQVVHAEGDAQPQLADALTLAEFAQRNRGNFLVVTVELH